MLIIRFHFKKKKKRYLKACLESQQWYHWMHSDSQLKYVKYFGMAELAHIPVTSPSLLQLTFLYPLYISVGRKHLWSLTAKDTSLSRHLHIKIFSPLKPFHWELPHCRLWVFPSVQDYLSRLSCDSFVSYNHFKIRDWPRNSYPSKQYHLHEIDCLN